MLTAGFIDRHLMQSKPLTREEEFKNQWNLRQTLNPLIRIRSREMSFCIFMSMGPTDLFPSKEKVNTVLVDS